MSTTNEHTPSPETPLLYFKQVAERLGYGPTAARKVIKVLEATGKLHRFQPSSKVQPRWYASEIAEIVKPPTAPVRTRSTASPILNKVAP